jgi:outer membrane receptor protein involved in Fe transport
MKNHRLWLGALLLPAVAQAQEIAISDGARLPEELVVAGFRTTDPRELDTSITLLDGQTIQDASIGNFEELVQLVPNMNFSGEGSRARYFQLRGVGEREQYEGAPNPSVGYIVDDIDLSGIGGITSTYDLQQIDILRGPQSARYGSSALAGIVYVQSAMPTEELEGNFELTGGSEDTFAAGAAVGGGITDDLKGRFSVYQYQDNGFRDNEFLGKDDTNERDELTVRGKLAWDVADDWEVLISGLYADADNGYDAWTIFNGDRTQSNSPGEDSQETAAGSVRVTGGIARAFDVVSITSVANSDVDFSFDGDWGNEAFWQTFGADDYDYVYLNPRERDTISQELRLVSTPEGALFDNTDWVVGVFWLNLDEDNQISSTGFYEDPFCPPGACVTDRQISSEFDSDTYAVFAGTDTRFTDQWTLSIGLRYERWEADYSDTWTDINFAGPPNNETCRVAELDCEPDENLWGGHVALSYDWNTDLRTYARIARGFKAGGFNPSLAALQGSGATLGPEFLAYDDETLWNYELGLKGAWLDGDLTADVAVFYMDRQDAQLSQSSQQVPFDPNSFVFVSYNGDADVYGLEFSGAWQFAQDWQLHGALGLLDSEIKSSTSTNAVSPNAVNRDLAHAPGYTATIGAAYRNDAGWFGRFDVVAVDEFYFDISNNQKSDSYEVVNLRLGKDWVHWTVEAWGRNIFDEDYATRGFFFGNEPPLFEPTLYTKFGDPRTIGATLRYRY